MRLQHNFLPNLGASGRPPIPLPTGFSFDPGITLTRVNGAISVGTYDVASRSDIPTGVTYYVNPATGNNSNNGLSSGMALKDISTAIAKSDVSVVILAPGVYNRLVGGWKGVTCSRSVSVKSDGNGTVILTNHQEFASGSWTQDPTHTNVWSTTRSFTYAVLNSTATDANGDYVKCAPQASVAACNGVSNSCFISGATVYVNLDGANPALRAWLLVDNNIVSAGNTTLYLENLTVIGGSACCIHENTNISQTSKFFAKNCIFKFALGNGVQLEGVSLAILQNCVAARNGADGFNYHAQFSTEVRAIEINCTGRHNGTRDGVDGNDQGSTMHEDGSIVRINGSYHHNGGGNCVDIQTSETWMLGCELYNSEGGVSNSYNVSGNALWLDTCNLHDSSTDILGNANVHNTTYATITGTATPY